MVNDNLTLIETLPSPFPDVWGVFAYWSINDVASIEVQFTKILFFGLYTPSDCAEKCDPENPPTIFPFVPSLVEAGSYAPAFSKHLVEAAITNSSVSRTASTKTRANGKAERSRRSKRRQINQRQSVRANY